VLFQMVTGSPPFDGESSQQIVGKHIAEPPPAAADVNPDVPRRLSDIILRCLAKKPGDRFPSAAAVIDALEGDQGGPPSTERSRAVAAKAATEVLVSGATKKMPVAVKPRRLRWIVVAGVLLLPAIGAGAFYMLRPPTLVFENRLASMVAVQVAGEERRILPGGSFSLSTPRGQQLDLTWRLLPTRGFVFGDTITIANPSGRVRVTATARPTHGAFFAPAITNETGEPLTITVNAGLAGAAPCDCTIPAGAVRMDIGYFPLFVNSTVRAEASGGRSATFTNLGVQVDATQGVVGLLYRATDLR